MGEECCCRYECQCNKNKCSDLGDCPCPEGFERQIVDDDCCCPVAKCVPCEYPTTTTPTKTPKETTVKTTTIPIGKPTTTKPGHTTTPYTTTTRITKTPDSHSLKYCPHVKDTSRCP